MMKTIIEEGEIDKLVADSGEAGWSGEAHIIKHNGKKYALRRCKTLSKAREYKKISSKLEKYGFLPKYLGSHGKDVVYEYIEGRDLRKKESDKIIMQVGLIEAYVNKVKVVGSISSRFNKHIRECTSGYFEIPKKNRKPILDKKKGKEMKRLFNYLRKIAKPNLTWDANDIYNENYRVRKGKVYLVDIEAIKPRIRGFGVGKAFTKWFKTSKERKAFERGYNSVEGKWFSQEYLDLIFLVFLTQEINYTCFFGKKYKPRIKIRFDELDRLLDKYKNQKYIYNIYRNRHNMLKNKKKHLLFYTDRSAVRFCVRPCLK